MRRIWRNLASTRGSVFVEYAMLAAFAGVVAVSAFAPDGALLRAIGVDYTFREVIIKLPFF